MLKNNLSLNLKNLFKSNQLFTSLIIDSKNLQEAHDVVNELIRYIYCENKNFDEDNCYNCQRSKKNSILDVVQIGNGSEAITKEMIQQMIEKMTLSSIEKSLTKVYIISCAENLKSSAANSLLKFLEEPPKNTFAILLSKNRSSILQTIKSRCKIFVLNNEDQNYELNLFEKILTTNNKYSYLLAGEKIKRLDKTELIKILEQSYFRTIVKKYSAFAEQTLILIDDLKFGNNDKLAIENYFIKISERL
ncbi:DNA polymerase III subunit delta' [Williamsoniiplasma somnilux]|uniref:DNA polymerase III subunit delta n=1 Tax=Williamsoniiplasma somnilux TaxID=215578 RepID=A0A2K8P2I4_9MOLU|nr:hypothetical protein [Williamsoniiplasma somnilux]ATZ19103.1 DNA polymerase III subunit delta' [Williamsoniiplasma somnilux]